MAAADAKGKPSSAPAESAATGSSGRNSAGPGVKGRADEVAEKTISKASAGGTARRISPAVDRPSSAPASVGGGGGGGLSNRSGSERRGTPTPTSSAPPARGCSSSRGSPVFAAQDGDDSKDRSVGEKDEAKVIRARSPVTVAATNRCDQEDARGVDYDARLGRAEGTGDRSAPAAAVAATAISSTPTRSPAEAATEISASDAIALASMRHSGGCGSGGGGDERAQSAARARSTSRSPSNHPYDGEQQSETAAVAVATAVRAAPLKVNEKTVKVCAVKSEEVEAEVEEVGARDGSEGRGKAEKNETGASAAVEEGVGAAKGGGGGSVSLKGIPGSPAADSSPEAVEALVEKLLAAQ